MEEFLTIFFQECDERLGELQDNLALLVDGDWDEETLNAAFRAVHSVKGGAGAFGLDELVEFTHIFETLMDRIRSHDVEPTEKVCQILLRASDMMSALIESAQGNLEPNREAKVQLMKELAELAGVDAPEASEAPAAPAAAEAQPEAAVEEEEFVDTFREIEIDFHPGPDFVRSGHDPLKFLRALKQFGSVKAEMIGELPAFEDADPMELPVSWKVTLDSETPLAEIEAFMVMYQLTADVDIRDPFAEQEAEAGKAEEQAEAPAESAEAPQEVSAEPTAEETAAKPEAKAEAKPEAKAEAAKSEGQKTSSAQQQRVNKALRVELTRIDRLVNMVGEIVITQAVLAQNFSELEESNDIQFAHAVEALSRQVRELQESVMAIRAQPVKAVFSRMPRVVRDLCSSLDKDVKLVLTGEHTEVDTTVIEELSEPLTHMLRNSMDHGVEGPEKREAAGKPRQGTIHLSAEQRGERVRIVIEDDGAGINRERVLEKAIANGVVSPEQQLSEEEIDMLIFHPGFSTAEVVTNVSGRGVGMDVVKKKVQALGGRVTVTSTPGKGTRFVITLPLTLAVLDGMTVGVGPERFILPLGSVVEAVKVDDSNIDRLPGDLQVLRYRGDWLPIICLRKALNLDIPDRKEDLVVVVETETDGRIAILVDELLGQRQVVLKSLEANFRRVDGVSGATILGDGRVALILDVPALSAISGVRSGADLQEVA